ncbi:restriction endonuclease subunit S [Candidatus Woesebacteria bacterium]|nr:restriction endonuclease subunit S [Candidatus Woesebacteria bacterium]
MKLNYKKLGDYIRLVDERNKNLEIRNLLGINIQKKFMPSVANTFETDLSKYKIINKEQFAYSAMQVGRDETVRVVLYSEEKPAIISPAYLVFEVIDLEAVLPEYLMMYFQRPESDRYGWFISDGSVRSSLEWERFCEIEIPIPEDIEIQKSVVTVYNELLRNQQCFERSLDDLQLICDQFINKLKKDKKTLKQLKPYIKQRTERTGELSKLPVQGVSNTQNFIKTKANTTNINFENYKVVKKHDFAYNPSRLNIGSIALRNDEDCIVSPIYVVFEVVNKAELLPEYLFLWFSRNSFCDYVYFYAFGSVRDTFEYSLMEEVVLPIPDIEVQKSIVAIHYVLESRKKLNENLKNMIAPLCPVLMKGVVDDMQIFATAK